MNTTKKILMVLATVAILCSCQSGDDDDSNVNTEYDDCMAFSTYTLIGLFECEGIPWNDEYQEAAEEELDKVCSEYCDDSPSDAHDYAVACGKSAPWVFDEDLGECGIDPEAPGVEACNKMTDTLPCVGEIQ